MRECSRESSHMMVVSLMVAGSVSRMSQSSVGMVCIHTLLDTSRRLELNFFPNIFSAETIPTHPAVKMCMQRTVSLSSLLLFRLKHVKSSGECYLLGQNTACEFIFIFHCFTIVSQLFTCCLTASLITGITAKNSHVVFCPNK